MSKPNKNKHNCDKYKSSGAYEFNKQKKQERHEKRMAHFAERRENGKAYEYKPNPYKQGSKKWRDERQDRYAKTKDKRVPLSQHDSIFRKLQNQLDKEEYAKKRAKEKEGSK